MPAFLKRQENPGRRSLERITTPKNLGFSAHLLFENQETLPAEMLDMNSEGLAVKINPQQLSGKSNFQIVSISVNLGKRAISTITKFQVVRVVPETGMIAVQFKTKNDNQRVRQVSRLRIKDAFVPLLLCPHPSRASEMLFFRLLDVSVTGLRLATSMSNKFLLPGMILEKCQLTLPGLTTLEVNLILRRANRINGEIEFGAEILNPQRNQLADIAQFCIFGTINSGSIRPVTRDLVEGGFPTKHLSKGVRIFTIESYEEYQQVLQVRFEAYKNAQKVVSGTVAAGMADEFDARSYILAASLSGKIVGTTRIVFCESADDPLPLERVFKWTLPGKDRLEAVEVSKLAVLPELQGTDMIVALFRNVMDISVRLGVRKIYCYSTKSLVPLYQALGAKKVGLEAPHSVLSGENLILLCIDLEAVSKGEGVSAHSWFAVHKGAVLHLSRFGFVSMPRNELAMRIRRAVEKVFLKFKKRIAAKRKPS